MRRLGRGSAFFAAIAFLVLVAVSGVRGTVWTHTVATRIAPDATVTYHLWERSGEAFLRTVTSDGEIAEERHCAEGKLQHAVGTRTVVVRTDISAEDCMAAVTDPLYGLWRRILDDEFTGRPLGSRDGQELVEFVMPGSYDLYELVVIDVAAARPVEAKTRSGETITWSYVIEERADAPPLNTIGEATESYLSLDLAQAADLLGSSGIPDTIGGFALESAQTATFASRPGPIHGVIWRDGQERELQVVLDVGMAEELPSQGLDLTDPAGPILQTIEGKDVISFYAPDRKSLLALVQAMRPDLLVKFPI